MPILVEIYHIEVSHFVLLAKNHYFCVKNVNYEAKYTY